METSRKCTKEKNSGRIMYQRGFSEGEKIGIEKAKKIIEDQGSWKDRLIIKHRLLEALEKERT